MMAEQDAASAETCERGFVYWRYRRPFRIGEIRARVTLHSHTKGLISELELDGAIVARDQTPAFGDEAVRNHRLSAQLCDGTHIEVDAGWISALNAGIAVRYEGELVHESHPGRTIAYPEKYREAATSIKADQTLGGAIKQGWTEGTEGLENYDAGVWKRNAIPLSVDIALGALFFVVAKMTDLTTAALVGAGVGIVLWIAQRITKIDFLGGLAVFGIVLMLISAGLAFAFQSDEAVKYRTTFVGLLSATLFFADGVARGKRLAKRMMLYLPYTDIDAARLGIGMGILGLVMAAANYGIATFTSTDIWLYYTTFGDFILTMALIILVFRYARGEMLRTWTPSYHVPRESE